MTVGGLGDGVVVHHRVGPADQRSDSVDRATVVIAEKWAPLRALIGNRQKLGGARGIESAPDVVGDARILGLVERKHRRPALVHLRRRQRTALAGVGATRRRHIVVDGVEFDCQRVEVLA